MVRWGKGAFMKRENSNQQCERCFFHLTNLYGIKPPPITKTINSDPLWPKPQNPTSTSPKRVGKKSWNFNCVKTFPKQIVCPYLFPPDNKRQTTKRWAKSPDTRLPQCMSGYACTWLQSENICFHWKSTNIWEAVLILPTPASQSEAADTSTIDRKEEREGIKSRWHATWLAATEEMSARTNGSQFGKRLLGESVPWRFGCFGDLASVSQAWECELWCSEVFQGRGRAWLTQPTQSAYRL